MLVCEDLRSKEVKKSKHEDMLWVCVEGGDEKLLVGGIHIVPTSSSREESGRIKTRVGRRCSKIPARRDSHGRRRLELQDWRDTVRSRR